MTSSGSSLENRIALYFDNLTPKQQVLAQLILDNRYFASFASAAEIGDKVEASAATVIRLCQALGYQGLPDLQAAIRSQLPSYLTAVERLERRLTVQGAEGELPQRAIDTDMQNLQRTAGSLSSPTFGAVVNALDTAREIIVIGAGVSAAPALFLSHSLQVIGLRARAVHDGDIVLAVATAHVSAEDVAVAIGVWRYVVSTVEALTWMKAAGAATVAITDSIVSPLARQADYAFEVATEGVAHSLSVTAMMTLINALVAEVSLRNPDRTRSALQRVERQFQERSLLVR
jgi:DNA-binding MurR/RpiR family transcriptional regulator